MMYNNNVSECLTDKEYEILALDENKSYVITVNIVQYCVVGQCTPDNC